MDPSRRAQRFLALKADPAAYEAFLKSKRDSRAAKKAAKESRFREISLGNAPLVLDAEEQAQQHRSTQRQTRAFAIRLAYEGGKSTTEIAKDLGISPGAVFNVLKAEGVTLRSKSEATSLGVARWHKARRCKG